MSITNQFNSMRFPRYHRLGGYTISLESAAEWAYRVEGSILHPVVESATTYMILRPILKHHHIDFKKVGEAENSKFMFVTQSGPFNGYVRMPSSEIKQFKKCSEDEMVKQLLDSQGVRDYKFETVLI